MMNNRQMYPNSRSHSTVRGASGILIALMNVCLCFSQPTIPQFEIFWLEHVPTDSSITVKIEWYPSATLDTNEVQFIEYDKKAVRLQTVGYLTPSDTVRRTVTLAPGFKQNSIVYLRWRAYNAAGSSEWSDVMWFATNEMTNRVVLRKPTTGEMIR